MTSDNYTNNRLNYNSNNCLSHSNWRKHFPLQGKLYPLTNTQNFHSNTFFRTLLVVLMMVVGNVGVWGQTDYSGTYYIAYYGYGSYNESDPVNNYYWCPVECQTGTWEGWFKFYPDDDDGNDTKTDTYSKTDTGMDFLTTYKCWDGDYDSQNAQWIITKHETQNGYYIQHKNSSKYLTMNGAMNGTGSTNRLRVHLQESIAPDNKSLFVIEEHEVDNYGTSYVIRPFSQNKQYINVSGKSDGSNTGNYNFLYGTDGKTDGPEGLKNVGGTLGWYNDINDKNGQWYLERVYCANPKMEYDPTTGELTITSATVGATIKYTTDGTDPSTGTTYDDSNKPVITTRTDVKAIAQKTNKEDSEVITQTIVVSPVIDPIASVTYNGLEQQPAVTVKDGETEIPASEYTTSYRDNKNAGTATVTISGKDGGNYILSGSATFTIAQATLTATAEDKSVTYGSDAPAYTVSYSGFLNGDSEEDITTPPTFYSTYSTTSNVGTYPIIISSMGVATNYSFKYRKGTLTVTPATATVTADEGKTKVYGEADPELTATVTGLLNSDSESVITYTLSRAEGENVGTYAITPSGDELQGNYSVNYVSKDFTITKAPLTVTAKNHAITYGDAPSNGGVSYSGFVNSDTKSVLSGTLTYTYSYSQYGDIGNSYTITPSGLTAANYNLSYNNGTLTVNQKEIGLSWDGTPLIYNGDPHTLTANATGLVNSDEIVVTVTLSAQEGSSLTDGNAVNAGNYLATASSISGPKAGNYKLPSTDTHLFTISPKVLGDGTRASSGIDVMMTISGTSYIVTVTDTEIDENTLLTENTDYTLSEANDVVTISGINNYTGSARLIYATATFATPDEEHIPAKDGYGAAYMSAMDVLPPSDVKVYVVKKVSPTIGTVTLSEIDYIPEGVPVIMLADNDQTGFAASPIDFTSASIVPISDAVRKSNLLRVSNGSIEVKDAQAYMFYRGEFVLTLAGTIGARKFFIYNPDYTEKTTPAFVRYLQFVIEDDETSINEELKEKNDKIATDESWYTLDGQRLNGRPARKGLYIMNGKKMTLDGK